MEGGLPPDYVLTQMQPFEIEIALDGLHLKHKDLWEATRMIMYVIAQVNSRSQLNPKDVLSLPWDSDAVDEEPAGDRYEEMKKEMSNLLNKMNNASGFSDKSLA